MSDFVKDTNVPDDTISRQAAIDAQPKQDREFMKLTVRNSNGRPYYSIIYMEFGDNGVGHDFEGYSSYSLDVISDYLKKYFMPSAKPEEIALRALHESCTDCPLYDKDRHRCPRFNKVIPETLREVISAQPDYQEVLGWLLAYHTKSFDVHGRYLPHEVISWLINDFTRAFIAERGTDETD